MIELMLFLPTALLCVTLFVLHLGRKWSSLICVLLLCVLSVNYWLCWNLKEYIPVKEYIEIEVPYEVPVEVNKPNSRLKEYITRNRNLPQADYILERATHWAKYYKLPLELVVSVMKTESAFRPEAVSSAGARGLMQVMWKYHYAALKTHCGLKDEKDLHDINLGIRAGCYVLNGYLSAEGSVTKALGRYYGEINSNYLGTTLSNLLDLMLFMQGREAKKETWTWVTPRAPKTKVAKEVKQTEVETNSEAKPAPLTVFNGLKRN